MKPNPTGATPVDEQQVDAAIAEAHLPTLVMSIVHLTGDTSLLKGERPVYALFDERQRTYSDETRKLIRQQARAAILAHLRSRGRRNQCGGCRYRSENPVCAQPKSLYPPPPRTAMEPVVIPW